MLPVAAINVEPALKMNTDFAVPLARNREMLVYYRRRLEEEPIPKVKTADQDQPSAERSLPAEGLRRIPAAAPRPAR